MRALLAAFINRYGAVEAALKATDRVTAVAHDHPEGMESARATTHAIWPALQGDGAERI